MEEFKHLSKNIATFDWFYRQFTHFITYYPYAISDYLKKTMTKETVKSSLDKLVTEAKSKFPDKFPTWNQANEMIMNNEELKVKLLAFNKAEIEEIVDTNEAFYALIRNYLKANELLW